MPMPQSNGARCTGCISFLVTAGFIVLIYWATYQPHHIRATVTSAALSNLTVYDNATAAGATVSYHLSVSLSLHNPSRRVNIYYDSLDTDLRFGDTVLGPANEASPTEFYQLRKSTDAVEVKLDRRGVVIAGDVAAELQKEVKDERAVSFEVVISARVRYQPGREPSRAGFGSNLPKARRRRAEPRLGSRSSQTQKTGLARANGKFGEARQAWRAFSL